MPSPIKGAIYLGLDTETTGLGDEATVLTVYLSAMDSEFAILDELDIQLKPNDGIYHVSPRALEVNKIDLVAHDKDPKTMTYKAAAETIHEFILRWSNDGERKLTPVGHNLPFDIRKLVGPIVRASVWAKCIDYRCLDSQFAAVFMKFAGLLPASQAVALDSLRKYIGISTEGAHAAKKDVLDSIAVLRFLKQKTIRAPQVERVELNGEKKDGARSKSSIRN